MKNYPQNSDAMSFVRRSVCGYNGKIPYVCCVTQSTKPTQVIQAQDRNVNSQQQGRTQQQIQIMSGGGTQTQQQSSSVSLLPKCNFDLDNRIFGGTKSSINDFGWLALLRYSKRKH